MSLEQYRKALDDNAIAFEVNCPEESKLFNVFDSELEAIINQLNSRPELLEVHQRIASIFLVIIHRQFRSGFELYRRRQSIDGDSVMRNAIECVCHYCKIFKYPELAEVYANKEDDFKRFEKEFLRNMFVSNLKHCERLKKIREMINNSASHPEIINLSQSIEFEEQKWNVHYFDIDNGLYQKKLWQFLDCYWRCIDSIRTIVTEHDALPISMTASSCGWNVCCKLMQTYTDRLRQIIPKPEYSTELR